MSITTIERPAATRENPGTAQLSGIDLTKLDHDHYVRGKLSEERYDELNQQQTGIRVTLEAEAQELARESDLTALMTDPETLRETWVASPLEEKRELIRCALRRVTLVPAKRMGDRTPMLERLVPEWVDGPTPVAGPRRENVDASKESVAAA
ncbi:hypothetical protein [Streptomyces sp. NPDC056524]|uniref:hypothetical protein n=1 Tax=Streptomyces sp. NPDC056524 TaxID=3345851 RepID=UPI0036C111E0